ncbi:MAG: ABC transporter ATP-binding protein [Spirochaetales bacterium]|nr:ABC transporter ATP-binding protein [Spirochaetales bacterium]
MEKREFRIENEYPYNRKSPFLWIVSHLLRYPLFPILLILAGIINNYVYGNIQVYIGKGFGIIAQSLWELHDLLFPAFIIMVSAVTQGLTGLVRNIGFEFLAQRIERNTREELYINLLGKSQSFHGQQRIGDIMARSTNDVRNLNYMFNPGLMLIFDSSLAFIMPSILIGILHPLLLIVPSIFFVFLVITVWEYNRRLKPVSMKLQEQFGTMNAGLTEAIEGIEVVKSAVRESYEWKKFTGDAGIFRDYFIKQGIIQAKYWPMLVFAVFWGLAILHGFWLWETGVIDIGKVIGFIGLFGAFRFSTFISIFSFNMVQLGMASAGRILSLITARSEIDENPQGVVRAITGKVTFKKVNFTYHNKQVLYDISFTVLPGETIAIVGQTGSGKTTLTRLINRIYDTTGGQVLVDDIDVRNWNMESLRSQISTIEQDVFLYSTTIRKNITFGREDATEEEIKQVAGEAQAHQFITKFSGAYDTEIGERGVTLSGGQKQRIAIARAFLSNPKILILDDSTSAIDSATEDEIQKAMKKISSHRTTFIITHRLSQIRWADKILVLKAGKLIDQGRHEELVQRCEPYKKIFMQ